MDHEATVTAAATPPSASTESSSSTAAAGISNANSVKIVIKACNQQHPDQVIESDLLWTVRRLKTQLSLVHPSKPAVAEQKLIYSGQLLVDTAQLKDVIRKYKDVFTQHHVFHLVCTPKNMTNSGRRSSRTTSAGVGSTQSTARVRTDGDGGADTELRYRGIAMGANTADERAGGYYVQQHNSQVRRILRRRDPQNQGLMSAAQTAAVGVRSSHQMAASTQTTPLTPATPRTQGETQTEPTPSVAASPLPAGNAIPPLAMPPANNDGLRTIMAQHAAMHRWMHEVYTHYMEHYMRNQNFDPVAGIRAQAPVPVGAPMPLPPLPDMPLMHGFFASPLFQNSGIPAPPGLGAVLPPDPSNFVNGGQIPQYRIGQLNLLREDHERERQRERHRDGPNTQEGGVVVGAEARPERVEAAAAADAEAALLQQAVAQPRFPNLDQEDQEARDWLDSFFSLTRLVFFLIILYFNSSPLRCLGVLIIAGSIYLYHIGVLRFRSERNNNGNGAGGRRRGNSAEQIRLGVQQVQRAQAAQQRLHQEHPAEEGPNGDAANAVAGDSLPEAPTGDAADGAGTEELSGAGVPANALVEAEHTVSRLATIRTFVVTLVTSLLPEAPAAM